MTGLLEIREIFIRLYKRYERMIMPIAKFIISLMVFFKLNNFLNYADKMSNPLVNIALALIVAFIPGNWFILITMLVIGTHLFFASLEAALLIGICMLIIYLLYIGIAPKLSYIIIAVPLLYGLNLHYTIPLFAGLFFGPISIIPVSIGVSIFYFSRYLPGLLEISSKELTDIPETLISMFQYLMNALLQDKAMLLTIIVFAIVIIITYVIKKLEIDYNWAIAVAAGVIINIIAFIIGKVILRVELSIIGLIFGNIIAGGILAITLFFSIVLDYSKAEKVVFEDDDYYYYVKAIPKIKINKAEKRVKRIN